MSYEVELKADVIDADALKKKIDILVKKSGKGVEKNDIYYYKKSEVDSTLDHIQPAFRIRLESDNILITTKRNHRVDGIETNVEVEFPVDKAYYNTTKEFASLLGYEILILKHKTGYEWMYNNIHVELLFVETLHWFLELEIVTDSLDNKENDVESLKQFLSLVDIPLTAINPNSYQSMLQAKQVKEK